MARKLTIMVSVRTLKYLHGAGILSGMIIASIGSFYSTRSVIKGIVVFVIGIALIATASYGWEKTTTDEGEEDEEA